MLTITQLIPARFVWLLLALGVGLEAAAYFIPAPWQAVAVGVGIVALYLGGKGFVAPKWATGKPLVPATLVPLLLTAAEVLQLLSHGLPATLAPHAGLLAGVLAFLAGKVEPAPVKVSVNGTAVTGTPVAVDQACDLEDAGRGLCK